MVVGKRPNATALKKHSLRLVGTSVIYFRLALRNCKGMLEHPPLKNIFAISTLHLVIDSNTQPLPLATKFSFLSINSFSFFCNSRFIRVESARNTDDEVDRRGMVIVSAISPSLSYLMYLP